MAISLKDSAIAVLDYGSLWSHNENVVFIKDSKCTCIVDCVVFNGAYILLRLITIDTHSRILTSVSTNRFFVNVSVCHFLQNFSCIYCGGCHIIISSMSSYGFGAFRSCVLFIIKSVLANPRF